MFSPTVISRWIILIYPPRDLRSMRSGYASVNGSRAGGGPKPIMSEEAFLYDKTTSLDSLSPFKSIKSTLIIKDKTIPSEHNFFQLHLRVPRNDSMFNPPPPLPIIYPLHNLHHHLKPRSNHHHHHHQILNQQCLRNNRSHLHGHPTLEPPHLQRQRLPHRSPGFSQQRRCALRRRSL